MTEQSRAAELADEIERWEWTIQPCDAGSYTTPGDVTLIVTALREKAERDAALADGLTGEWSAIVGPLAARFEVASQFGADAVHNAKGADAVARILRKMARIIDTEIVRRDAAPIKAGDDLGNGLVAANPDDVW